MVKEREKKGEEGRGKKEGREMVKRGRKKILTDMSLVPVSSS